MKWGETVCLVERIGVQENCRVRKRKKEKRKKKKEKRKKRETLPFAIPFALLPTPNKTIPLATNERKKKGLIEVADPPYQPT